MANFRFIGRVFELCLAVAHGLREKDVPTTLCRWPAEPESSPSIRSQVP